MKNHFLTTIVLLVYLPTLFAQVVPPQGFNYSGVARDANGDAIANTSIGIQFSILQANPSGSVVYQENHNLTSDGSGIFNLVIGAGAVQAGSMSSIDWSSDNHYLQVGLDINGGSDFVAMGTTQFLSVPYAMYASSAGTVQYQTISISNDTLFLSNGGYVVLPNLPTSGLAMVTTDSVTNPFGTKAVIWCNVTDNADELILARGVCWKIDATPTVSDEIISAGTGGLGAFSVSISNLVLSTNYHFRSFVSNHQGTAYGNEVIVNYQTANLVGDYNMINDQCSTNWNVPPLSLPHSGTITQTQPGSTQFSVYNLSEHENTVLATVSGSQLTIPSQTVNGLTYSGTGTWNGGSLNINYSFTDGTQTNSCTSSWVEP